ncbi:MAG: hypothetical protein COA78_32835 [Blastopirellula sp.]|nr:MAG: hypothetical protein COA78_32835 [Blastopirellula sp.]
MKEADISKALRERLEAKAGLPPIVYENKDSGAVVRPRLVLTMVRGSRVDPTLTGGGTTRHTGFMQVSIVSELDQHAFPSENLADDIADHFPRGLKLAGESGGTVTISGAEIGIAYRDGPDWRLPVKIDYLAS